MTTLTFIGTAAVLPGAGRESACFVINGRYLVDTGWSAAVKMQEVDCDPLAIEWLFFTHCHHDHYLGLPGLLFYRAMASRMRGATAPVLKIAGPPSDLPLVLERAQALLQPERFPGVCGPTELVPLAPGETLETEAFRLETRRSLHGVEGSVGRFTDRATGVVIAFSGDTGIHPELATLARGADLLIHEASLAPEADASRATEHSRAVDAARIAAAAGVARLRLIHLHGDHGERSLAAARAIFPATELAREGETLQLTRR